MVGTLARVFDGDDVGRFEGYGEYESDGDYEKF